MQTPAFYLGRFEEKRPSGPIRSETTTAFTHVGFKDEKYWTATYYNPYVVLYNTKLVAGQNLPKRYDDLLKSILGKTK